MNIDQFLELVKKRRSVRRFKPDPIPEGMIEKILEAARWAQSGSNAQSWEFIVVRDREKKKKITEIIARGWKRTFDVEQTRIPEVRHQKYMREDQGPAVDFKDAPVFILVCADPRPIQATALSVYFLNVEGGANAHWFKNTANATQIIHLAVAACGLGSEWVSVKCSAQPALRELLNIPDEISVHTLVPVGFPLKDPPPGVRRELSEMVHYDGYDLSKYRTDQDIINFLVNLRKNIRSAYPGK